jgi:hypothetical protein
MTIRQQSDWGNKFHWVHTILTQGRNYL